MRKLYHSELWGLLLDLVLHASPERGVLEGRGTQSPHNLLPNRERKQHMVFLPLAGLESVVGLSQIFSVFSPAGR